LLCHHRNPWVAVALKNTLFDLAIVDTSNEDTLEGKLPMEEKIINADANTSQAALCSAPAKIEQLEELKSVAETITSQRNSMLLSGLTDLKHIKSYYDVYAFKKAHPIIQQLKADNSQPKIHGHKVWDSSLVLMDYLENNPMPKKSRVMELGCGWGVLSIYCAKAFKAKVTGVDADANVFPFLDVHAALNGVSVASKVSRFEALKASKLGRQDYILGADICFWGELSKALFQTIKKAKKVGSPRIIIADPGRSPFFKLAKKCERKFGAELVEWDIHYPKRAAGYLLIIDDD